MLTRRTVLKRGGCVALVSAVPLFIRNARAQSATFDYYISTTGSDSNAGTLSAPWAITSLQHGNANNSKIAGKRVGLLPGTYNVYSLWLNAAWNAPALDIPGGTASTPTYIGSSNASGQYAARTAHITANNNGALPGSSGSSVAIMGQGYEQAKGYVTFDGLIVSDSNGYCFYLNGGGGNGGSGGGSFIVQNCEVYNVSGSEGNNPGCILFYNDSGSVVQNCLIHDAQIAGGGNHNCAGIFSFNCYGHTYQFNTIYNCNSGIYDKDISNGGHTYYGNYIEINGSNPINCVTNSGNGNVGWTRTVHNNIFVIAANTGQNGILIGADDSGSVWTPSESMVFYNNSIYVLSGGGVQNGLIWQSLGTGVSPTASVKNYNNIMQSSGAGYALVQFNPASGAVAISDYNCYTAAASGGGVFGTGTSGAPSSNYSLANWRTKFGFDTHTITGSPSFSNPGTNLGSGGLYTDVTTTAGYALAAGSPCSGTGSSNGTSSGTPCDMGAWGGATPPTQIGSNFGVSLSAPVTPLIPNAPVLTVG
jgi:hypothetical protein